MNKKGANFVDYPINFMWIALFIVVIVSFAIGLGNLYGKSSSDMIGNKINVTIFENEISSSNSQLQASYNATTEDELNTDTNILTIKSIWGSIKNTGSIIISMFNVLKTLIVDVLGIPAVAIYAVIGIFVIGLIFAIWRVISTGQ
jgi:hypothetical protein